MFSEAVIHCIQLIALHFRLLPVQKESYVYNLNKSIVVYSHEIKTITGAHLIIRMLSLKIQMIVVILMSCLLKQIVRLHEYQLAQLSL